VLDEHGVPRAPLVLDRVDESPELGVGPRPVGEQDAEQSAGAGVEHPTCAHVCPDRALGVGLGEDPLELRTLTDRHRLVVPGEPHVVESLDHRRLAAAE
jgi:hypothetical protein